MNRLCRLALPVAVVLSLTTPPASAQQQQPQDGAEIPVDNTGFGTTSGEFLNLGAGARGTALGGSFAALSNDVSALYWNPAGVVLNSRAGVEVSYLDYVAGTRYVWVGGVMPLGTGEWAIGAQVGSFGFGDQPEYTEADPDGVSGRTYDVSETFLGVTVARQFSDRFSAGITGKLINDVLGEADAQTVAFDFGTNFHTELGDRPIRASFVIQNLGGRLKHVGTGTEIDVFPEPGTPDSRLDPVPANFRAKGWPLPATFRVGLAYDALSMQNQTLTVLSEFTQPNNSDATFNVAGEYRFDQIGGRGLGAALRASYTYQPDEEQISCTDFDASGVAGDATGECTFNAAFESPSNSDRGLDGLAAGGGLKWEFPEWTVHADYALRHMGILDIVHTFSIGVAFGPGQ